MNETVHAACRARICAHFEGRARPAEERAMRGHLEDCGRCRTHYARYWALAPLDPRALDARERLGRGLGFREPWSSPWRSMAGSGRARAWLIAVASVAGLALFMLRRSPSPPELEARGVGPGAPVTLEVYHGGAGHPLVPAEGSLHASDELAFAYSDAARYPYLAVCGIDEHNHVYWYHPAWTSAAEDPASIPIQGNGRVEELPEAISQPLDGHRLRVISIFSRVPLHVREVERAIVAQGPNGSLQSRLEEKYGDVHVAERAFEVAP